MAEVLKWTGSGWTCQIDADTNYDGADFAVSSQTCASGHVTGIDASGNVICAPEVYFSVKRDTEYTWATNCATAEVNFSSGSTVWANQGGGLSGSTFTAPASGTYSLHGSVSVRGLDLTAGSNAYVYMSVAGKNYEADMFTSPVWSNQSVMPSVSVAVHMNAGQTARLYAYTCNNGGGGNASVYGNSSTTYAFTRFTGARVF
jgi:hypothetical protein